MKDFLEIGKIVGTHGIKGELRVDPWCDSPEFFCTFKTVYFNKGSQPLTVKSRPHKNIALMTIDGVETVEQADLLRGKILYINRSDVKLDKGVYFIQDLLGITVQDAATKQVYGTIADVLKTGANDVYLVKNDAGKEFLIPVIDDVVKSVDIAQGLVEITPMKGIFDDED